MRGLFNMDSGLFRFLSRLADIIILNLVFIVCSIPIVTIGASVTAMYYVLLKMKDNEEGYILRSFFHSFRQNVKQATVIWLIILLVAAVLGTDIFLVSAMEGSMVKIMQVFIFMGWFFWLMLFCYVFPLQAKFYNPIRATLRNALLLALGNFPWTICMMAVTVVAVVVTFWNGYTLWYGLLVWILGGFAGVGWINSHLLYRIFKKILPPEEKEPEDQDHWEVPEA